MSDTVDLLAFLILVISNVLGLATVYVKIHSRLSILEVHLDYIRQHVRILPVAHQNKDHPSEQ